MTSHFFQGNTLCYELGFEGVWVIIIQAAQINILTLTTNRQLTPRFVPVLASFLINMLIQL